MQVAKVSGRRRPDLKWSAVVTGQTLDLRSLMPLVLLGAIRWRGYSWVRPHMLSKLALEPNLLAASTELHCTARRTLPVHCAESQLDQALRKRHPPAPADAKGRESWRERSSSAVEACRPTL